MSDNPAGQVIQVPNTLRMKVGGRFGGTDAAAIAKAEAALKSLSGNFSEWLNDEIVKLDAARQRIRAEGISPETAE
ncbi:MAG TPA: Hpt domain-containing protein, partial [Caulobacteraceae bacterium]|nr:Hpt domain-containing protein [Caulobacteraceae bacterium]